MMNQIQTTTVEAAIQILSRYTSCLIMTLFRIVNSLRPATINTEQNLSNNNLTGEDLVIIKMKIVTSNEKETPNNKKQT